MSESSEPRRAFLTRVVFAGAGMVGAAIAGLAGAVATPRVREAARRWRPAASMFDLTPNGPFVATLAERHADGWHETRKESVVFIDKVGEDYVALSATCTHLGCRVAWDAAESHYKCPCHGGVFSREGAVVSGPPPEGLRRVPVRLNPETANLEVEI
ncbi:MAG: ubiquinol-cytochrome c reductase iron-sulfur subunit [Vicinamibacterales bacterium]